MNEPTLIAGIFIVYLCDIFALIWLSGKFAGIATFRLTDVLYIGLIIILFSWLIGVAFIIVPLLIKPIILLIACSVLIYLYTMLLDVNAVRAMAAGFFFVCCQFFIIAFLLNQLWDKPFFQSIKAFIFNYN